MLRYSLIDQKYQSTYNMNFNSEKFINESFKVHINNFFNSNISPQ